MTFYVLVCGVAVLLWPVLLLKIVKETRENTPDRIREFGRRSRAQNVPKGWLRNRITVGEAEAMHMVDLSFGDQPSETQRSVRENRDGIARSRAAASTAQPLPFGMLNSVWREMVDSMKEGDELWKYRSSEASWQDLAGREGIALVRNGEIVDAITTALN